MKGKLEEFWVVLMDDKKKAFALGGLAVVALGLWARAGLNGGPSEASAQTGVIATTENDAEEAETAPERERVEVGAIADLSRDLFDPTVLRPAPPAQPEPEPETLAKSEDAGTDEPASIEPVVPDFAAELRREAERIRLRSTMVGSVPIAVMELEGDESSRAIVRIGGRFGSFDLTEVTARSAVLQSQDVRVELRIQPQ